MSFTNRLMITKDVKKLMVMFIILNLMDIILTYILVTNNLAKESNPIMNNIFVNYGWIAGVGVKFVGVAGLCLYVHFNPDKKPIVVTFNLITLFYVLIIINNLNGFMFIAFTNIFSL